MKKNTVRLFALAITFASGMSASAQTLVKPSTESNISKSEAAAKYLVIKEKYEKSYAQALSLAKVNNWPLTVEKADGGFSALVKVAKNGDPVYLTTTNAGSALTSRANYLQPGGDSGLNLTGEYADGTVMYIGIWDGGYPLSTHQQLVNRTANYDNDVDGKVAYHPTHVTGTVIGSGLGNANAKGMASKAEVASFTFRNDGPEMYNYASFFVLSNHSYGYDISGWSEAKKEETRGSYIDESQEVDEMMFDNPYYLPVFAAGNDGDGFYDRLTDRSVSKNAIAVAATYEVANYVNDADVQIAPFSSWGPTNDNRIKPDISNKGVQVFSASNSSNTGYANENGTSMAAPGVTGALALVQQYYAILNTPSGAPADQKKYMRSATVRALVAHTADEAGFAQGPDSQFGWGLLNVKRAAQVLAADASNTSASVEELVLTPGQVVTRQITASGSESLLATIAWTDPAGAITYSNASVLVNDLDIKLTKGSEVHYPWKLDSFGEYAERGINSVDNVEKVEIDNPSGVYTLTISHKKSTLQNPGGQAQQAYSLILSGISSVPVGLEDSVVKMFTVWPNPATEQLNITFGSAVEKNASAVIYDVQGRQVMATSLLNTDNVLNVQGLAKGVYMVNVTNGEKTEVEKVIVK